MIGGLVHHTLKAICVKSHKWEYRNPYSRKCSICGRTEDYYQWYSVGGRPVGRFEQMVSVQTTDCIDNE